jgi:hypothetical protein
MNIFDSRCKSVASLLLVKLMIFPTFKRYAQNSLLSPKASAISWVFFLQIDESSTHQNSGNTYITYSCTVTIFSIIFMLNIYTIQLFSAVCYRHSTQHYTILGHCFYFGICQTAVLN